MNVLRHKQQVFLLLHKHLLELSHRKIYALFELLLPLAIIPIILYVIGTQATDTAKSFRSTAIRGSEDDAFSCPHLYVFYELNHVNLESTETLLRKLQTRFGRRAEFRSVSDVKSTIKKRGEEGTTNCTIGIEFEQLTAMPNRPAASKLCYRFHKAAKLHDEWNLHHQWPWTREYPSREAEKHLPSPDYFDQGILSLQRAIDDSFIEILRKSDVPLLTTFSVQRTPLLNSGDHVHLFMAHLPGIFGFFLLFIVIHTASEVLSERENGIVSYLIVMGVKSWAFYVAHVVIASVKVFLLVIPSAALLFAFTEHTNGALFFALVIFHGVALLSFAFLMANLFSSTVNMIKTTVLVWLLSLLGHHIYDPKPSETFLRVLFSFNLNAAFRYALEDVVHEERFGDSGDRFAAKYVVIIMIFNVLWMNLLNVAVCYVNWERITKLWKKMRKINVVDVSLPSQSDGALLSTYIQSEIKLDIESADIVIEDLTKTWKTTGSTAIDGLNLKVYRGHVTALLGHNGAGKSTLISVITGMTQMTSGKLQIGPKEKRPENQSLIGFCPQKNCVFEFLTVAQHLRFMARLKGKPEKLEVNITELCTSLDLLEKKDVLAKNLSEGMKRKLCVGMALIGQPQILLLDEPTAGMDAGGRQMMREILDVYKEEKTVLMSTHYMEEAELMADRIAILVNGKLKCYGSPDYLKRKCSAGYVLSVEMAISEEGEYLNLNEKKSHPVVELVKTHIASAHLLDGSTTSAIKISLPANEKKRFTGMFKELEMMNETLGIEMVGLSINSMEQVFVKVVEGADAAEGNAEDPALNQAKSLTSRTEYETRALGLIYFCQQAFAIVKRRLFIVKRFPVRSLFVLLAPLLFIALVALFGVPENKNVVLAEQNLTYSLKSLAPSKVVVTRRMNEKITNQLSATDRGIQEVMERNMRGSLEDLDFTDLYFHRSSVVNFIRRYSSFALGFVFSSDGMRMIFNGQLFHATVIGQNVFSNSFIAKEAITVSMTRQLVGESKQFDSTSMIFNMIPFVVAMTVAFVVTDSVSVVAEDKLTLFQHQMTLAGLNPLLYWLINFTYDLIPYCTLTIFTIGVLYLSEAIVQSAVLQLATLFFAYYLADMISLYLIPFVFSSTPSAYAASITWNVVVPAGFFLFVSYSISYLAFMDSAVLHGVKVLLMVVQPTFALFVGMLQVFQRSAKVAQGVEIQNSEEVEAFDITVLSLLSSAGFYGILLTVCQETWLRVLISKWRNVILRIRMKRKPEFLIEDDDVAREREAVAQSRRQFTDPPGILSVFNLFKFYGRSDAVRSISFGVNRKQSVGILGVNGAGKTSVFNVVTSRLYADGGSVEVDDLPVTDSPLIAYCPQTNSLLSELTVKQTLTILAEVHGFKRVKDRVALVIDCVNLGSQTNQIVTHLSYGQKRRLSIGIVLLPHVQLILLDEPTTGVDACVRRKIWNLLTAIRRQNRAMLLTSHCVEECEALCEKIAYMHAGKIAHIGSPQYFKSRFGDTYRLTMTVRKSSKKVFDSLNEQVVAMFNCPRSNSNPRFATYVWFIQRKSDLRWSQMFTKMETILKGFGGLVPKTNSGKSVSYVDSSSLMLPFDPTQNRNPFIVDYTLAQSSLETVFFKLVADLRVAFDGGEETTLKTTVEPSTQVSESVAVAMSLCEEETGFD